MKAISTIIIGCWCCCYNQQGWGEVTIALAVLCITLWSLWRTHQVRVLILWGPKGHLTLPQPRQLHQGRGAALSSSLHAAVAPCMLQWLTASIEGALHPLRVRCMQQRFITCLVHAVASHSMLQWLTASIDGALHPMMAHCIQ